MGDWQWVPWTVAALSVVATSIFGGLNYKHSKRSRGDTLVHQEHSRGLDVLGVARSELGARIEAAKAEIQLAVLTVDHKLDQAHSVQASLVASSDVLRANLDQLRGELEAQHHLLLRAVTDISRNLEPLYKATNVEPHVIDLTGLGRSGEAHRIDLTVTDRPAHLPDS